jgi:hypothetical protein
MGVSCYHSHCHDKLTKAVYRKDEWGLPVTQIMFIIYCHLIERTDRRKDGPVFRRNWSRNLSSLHHEAKTVLGPIDRRFSAQRMDYLSTLRCCPSTTASVPIRAHCIGNAVQATHAYFTFFRAELYHRTRREHLLPLHKSAVV